MLAQGAFGIHFASGDVARQAKRAPRAPRRRRLPRRAGAGGAGLEGQVRLAAGGAAALAGDEARARAAFERAGALLDGPAVSAERARAFAGLARLELGRGDLVAAARLAGRAVDEAGASGEP